MVREEWTRQLSSRIVFLPHLLQLFTHPFRSLALLLQPLGVRNCDANRILWSVLLFRTRLSLDQNFPHSRHTLDFSILILCPAFLCLQGPVIATITEFSSTYFLRWGGEYDGVELGNRYFQRSLSVDRCQVEHFQVWRRVRTCKLGVAFGFLSIGVFVYAGGNSIDLFELASQIFGH